MTLEYNCPNCDKELEGGFGDSVTCDVCNKTYETDWDYVGSFDDMSIACWITEEIKPSIILIPEGVRHPKDSDGLKITKKLTLEEVLKQYGDQLTTQQIRDLITEMEKQSPKYQKYMLMIEKAIEEDINKVKQEILQDESGDFITKTYFDEEE